MRARVPQQRRRSATHEAGHAAEYSEAGHRFLEEALAGAPGLRRYLTELVHDVRVREDIATARVRLEGGKFLLEISPEFLATTLPAPEDKRFVLMHEIDHLLRGDLLREGRFYRRLPRMVNFAMDMYVNGSVLGSRYFDGRAPQVLDRCYDPRSRPYCLLQPPWRLLEAWSEEVPAAAAQIGTARYVVKHRTLRWDDDRTGPPRAVLERLVTVTAEVLSKVGFRRAAEAASLYLGAASGTLPFNGFLQRLQRLLVEEELLEVVEGRPLLLEHDLEALAEATDHGNGARLPGLGGPLERRNVPPEPPSLRSEARRTFFQALRAALVSDPAHPTLRRDADVSFPSVLLHMGRREAALLAAGIFPIFCHAPGQALGMSDERVHLYLDVSGSMDNVISFVTGLALTAGPIVGAPLYQFSNQVVAITWEELEQGFLETTGGTDLDCVARHAKRQGHSRILIVTDGLVSLEEESRRILKRDIETYVVFIDRDGIVPDHWRKRVEEYARQCWAMPPV